MSMPPAASRMLFCLLLLDRSSGAPGHTWQSFLHQTCWILSQAADVALMLFRLVLAVALFQPLLAAKGKEDPRDCEGTRSAASCGRRRACLPAGVRPRMPQKL